MLHRRAARDGRGTPGEVCSPGGFYGAVGGCRHVTVGLLGITPGR